MKKLTFLMTLSVLFLVGCSTEEVQITDSSNENLNQEFSRGRVIHHVTLAGNDYCEAIGAPAGCDANFSITANMYADGRISGQWHDVWAGGVDAVHVKIDCMIVVDNWAILGGFVTNGSVGGFDLTGFYVYTAVVDNGTSNKDAPDQLSLTFFETSFSCEFASSLTPSDFPLFDIKKGQVKVW